MSKNSRIPERGMARTFSATNDSGLNGAAMCMREPRGVPRGRKILSGSLVLPAPDDRLGLVHHDRSRDLHRDDVIGARNLIHNIEHDFLKNPAQRPSAG